MDALAKTITIVGATLGVIGIAGAVFSFLRYGNYRTTVDLQNDSIKALKENQDILKGQVEESRKEHLLAVKEIANLQGQVKTYKEIPLQDIATSLASVADSNNKILAILTNAAIIPSKDGAAPSVEVHTKPNEPLDVNQV